MSAVWIDPSSRTMWCVTTSLFLNTTTWPAETAAGLGLKAAFPPCPGMGLVPAAPPPPPDGPVGVDPPPPQLATTSATATASAAFPALYMALSSRRTPEQSKCLRKTQRSRLFSAPYGQIGYARGKRLRITF